MKKDIIGTVGKTIRSIIISHTGHPRIGTRVYLCFSDNTSFEIYGDPLLAGGVDKEAEADIIDHCQRNHHSFELLTTDTRFNAK